ncbi:MerR family DNA-binding transcriptional regulator [uncultured Clostridium sp.]|uniref:MerR family DNA-binding transcriptional regulator n=1 Tax=uncultured Clostridium sp. TaxID=59620 RepID=UPI0025879B76|nr:MerR family transcriptional regulator [uncultured Clostridium sp.]
MQKLFSIGEVSKLKDITIKSLRYYHQEGILVPKYIDNMTGYRYYSIDQFIYIDIIKTCRILGGSINEIKEIFKECDTEKLLKFLEVKKKESEEKISKMREVIKNIDILDNLVKQSKEKIKDKDIKIETLKKRYIIKSPFEEIGNLNEVIYYSYLDKEIKNNNIKANVERGIIYDINSKNEFVPKFVFTEVDNNLKECENIDVLPQGTYLTVIYNNKDEDKIRKDIISYAEENNFEIKNIIMIEIFDNIFNTYDYNCQIQILIEENNDIYS